MSWNDLPKVIRLTSFRSRTLDSKPRALFMKMPVQLSAQATF